MEGKKLGIILTISAALLWSTGGLFIKVLPQDAFTILCYRSFFAALIFIVVFRSGLMKVNRLTILASLFYAPILLCFVNATKLTTAANAIFLQYIAPGFILLIEPILFKTKLTKLNIISVIGCFLGIGLFFLDQFSTPDQWLGVYLALLSGLMLAGLLLVQRLNEPEYQPSAIFFGNMWVVIITIPWMLESGIPQTNHLMMLVFVGVFQLGLGFVLFTKGQKHITALESSLLAMLEPILSPIWVMIGYGEIPGVWALVGGLVIIATLFIRMLILYRLEKIKLL